MALHDEIKEYNALETLDDIMNSVQDDNFNDLMDGFAALVDSCPNAKAVTIALQLGLNKVVPFALVQSYRKALFIAAEKKLGFDEKMTPQIRESIDKIVNVMENPDSVDGVSAFDRMLMRSMRKMDPDNMVFSIDKMADRFEKGLKRSAELIEKGYVSVQHIEGVTFYHGTSYENYLQIVKDGKIKRSDYSHEDYTDTPNTERLYSKETGYVFVDDSLDKPVNMARGGYRTNWLNNFRKTDGGEDENDYTEADYIKAGLLAVFEIDPKPYNVSFIPYKGEFVIDSDVDIKGLNVRFYICDREWNIREVSKKEIQRVWKECCA